MKTKPHHSTVFRRKALAEIDSLKAEATRLERRIVDLSLANSKFYTKLSAQATQLAALTEARNNLLKDLEESKKTVEVLIDALTTIHATASPIIGPLEDPARQAVEAVRQLREYSEKKDVELHNAKSRLTLAEGEIAALKGEIASINSQHAAFLESEKERYAEKFDEALALDLEVNRSRTYVLWAVTLFVFTAVGWLARELTRGSL